MGQFVEFDLASFPWLLIVVALGPILLFLPLLAELLRRRDIGPRPLPPPGAEASMDVIPVGDPVNPDPSVVRIEGNLQSRGRSFLNHLVVHGHIALPPGVTVEGTIKATEQVELGDGATVKGDIVAGGDVFLGALAKVEGVIDSGGTVVLRRGAEAEAIIAKGGTSLAEGVEITKRVVSGRPIVIQPGRTMEAPALEEAIQPSFGEIPADELLQAPEPLPHEALAEIEDIERSLEGLEARPTPPPPEPLELTRGLPEAPTDEVPPPEAPVALTSMRMPVPSRRVHHPGPSAPIGAPVASLVAVPPVAVAAMPLPKPRGKASPSPSISQPSPTGMVMKFPGGARRVQHSV